MAFEVHLPQVVGCLVLKSLPGTVLGPLGWVNATMTTQDRRDSTGGRHVRLKHIPAVQKPPSQLTSSPGRMCRTGRQYRLLNLRWGACRRVVGPPRQVDQACLAPFAEPPKPLVSSRRADPEATAKGPLVGAFSLRQLHELSPLRHNGHLLPWHDHLLLMKSCLLWCPLCLRTCVSYLPGLRGSTLSSRIFGDCTLTSTGVSRGMLESSRLRRPTARRVYRFSSLNSVLASTIFAPSRTLSYSDSACSRSAMAMSVSPWSL